MAILLTKADVERLLDMRATIAILEQAFAELASGAAVLPQRTPIKVEGGPGVALFMPAFLPGLGSLGAKVVTVFGQNPARHSLPAVLGTIILLDSTTGEPLCIMEGGYLTAMRTGGASGVATKHLARPDSKVHGLLGSSVQARTQAWAVATAVKLERCLVYSLDPLDKQLEFANDVAELTGVPTRPAGSVRELVEQSDVLTLATSAGEPVLDGDWVKPGTHINGIGSHAPQMRELDTATVVKSTVVCDLLSACQAEAGDLIIPAAAGEWSWERAHADLGQIVRGAAPGRSSAEEITLFKSVGLAIQDLSTAWQVYTRARELGVGVQFNFR